MSGFSGLLSYNVQLCMVDVYTVFIIKLSVQISWEPDLCVVVVQNGDPGEVALLSCLFVLLRKCWRVRMCWRSRLACASVVDHRKLSSQLAS